MVWWWWWVIFFIARPKRAISGLPEPRGGWKDPSQYWGGWSLGISTGRLWDLLSADQLRSWAATWKVPRAAGSDHASLVASIEGADRPLPLPREIARVPARMAIMWDCSAGGPFGQSAALAAEGSAKQCHS